MWWKRYIGNPNGVKELKRGKLEDLLLASCEQVEKMQKQEIALQSEIKDLSVEQKRKTTLGRKENILGKMEGANICPTNYYASHHRATQLESQLTQLKMDLENLNESISYDEELLRQMIVAHNVEQPVPKQSLKIAPFNNSDLRKITQFLVDLLKRSTDPDDIEELTLCRDLLYGDSKLIGRFMNNIRENFEDTREQFENDLDALTAQCQQYIKKVAKLREQMETLSKKIESIIPQMPSVKKDLQKQVDEMGDTHTPYVKISDKVKELRSKKEKLKDECTEYATSMILRPLDAENHKTMLDESVRLKETMLLQEMEINESKQRKTLLTSLVKSAQEAQKQSEKDVVDIQQQCEKVRVATQERTIRNQQLEGVNVHLKDMELIQVLSQKTTVDQIEEYRKKLKERVTAASDKSDALVQKIETLREQNQKLKQQIREMNELIQVSKSQK